MCLYLSYKKKYGKKLFFGIPKVTEEVGSEVGSGSESISQMYGSAPIPGSPTLVFAFAVITTVSV
jgi:hypothetical protein